ncbi:MAG: hypothetical protein KGR25_01795, partial [Chloroflexi bacterium]|nr:hypothetical protein [Chloroflexota bacterium]
MPAGCDAPFLNLVGRYGRVLPRSGIAVGAWGRCYRVGHGDVGGTVTGTATAPREMVGTPFPDRSGPAASAEQGG